MAYCVYARVGSATCGQRYGVPDHVAKDVQDVALNGALAWLYLPAVKHCAVVR